jgi:hypothetical protein
VILWLKIPLRPKYLLIRRLRKNITLSGRRWKTHGSSKESGGKEAGKEGSGKEDRSKEEIIFFDLIILHFFDGDFSGEISERSRYSATGHPQADREDYWLYRPRSGELSPVHEPLRAAGDRCQLQAIGSGKVEVESKEALLVLVPEQGFYCKECFPEVLCNKLATGA